MTTPLKTRVLLADDHEVVRSGLRSVLELTDEGRAVLAERRSVLLAVPAAPPRGTPAARRAVGRTAAGDDDDMFEALRALRKRIADERDVPAYVIFPDVTLRAMARDLPRNATELRAIPGVGDKKLVAFGELFLSEIRRLLATSP